MEYLALGGNHRFSALETDEVKEWAAANNKNITRWFFDVLSSEIFEFAESHRLLTALQYMDNYTNTCVTPACDTERLVVICNLLKTPEYANWNNNMVQTRDRILNSIVRFFFFAFVHKFNCVINFHN